MARGSTTWNYRFVYIRNLRVQPTLRLRFLMLLREDSPFSRTEVCARLAQYNIDTRPISGSNLARQPAFADLPTLRVEGETPVADAIHERGFFVGQSHAFGDGHGELLRCVKAIFFRSIMQEDRRSS